VVFEFVETARSVFDLGCEFGRALVVDGVWTPL